MLLQEEFNALPAYSKSLSGARFGWLKKSIFPIVNELFWNCVTSIADYGRLDTTNIIAKLIYTDSVL